MSTPPANVVKIDWKHVAPWTALFQTFGLALHVRQVFVGTIAALLIAAPQWNLLDDAGKAFTLAINTNRLTFADSATWTMAPLLDLIRPLFSFTSSEVTVPDLTTSDQSVPWSAQAVRLGLMIWTFIIGGLAGGILVRRAGIEFTREESLSLRATIRYVLKRSFDYISAPLLPFCGVLAIGLMGVALGLLFRLIPGSIHVLAATWIVPLTCGVLAATLLFAVIAGWAMMVSAISINSGDGFDALSRGFGCVLDRWRYYAFCVAILLGYGYVALFIVLKLLEWGHEFAVTALIMGLGQLGATINTPGPMHETWNLFISLLLRGLAYSFFWSGMMLTYLLLRKSLDNAELNSIYVDEPENSPDGLAALRQKNPVPEAMPTLLPIIELPNSRS